MVLADFLTETRRRWLKAFKLFKRSKSRKYTQNRISPALVRSPSYSGTVDARAEIDLQRFCACAPLERKETDSNYSSYNSSNSSRVDSFEYGTECNRSDSAYESARSSPAAARLRYATVTYYDSDSSSVRTDYTLLEDTDTELEDDLERAQNIINESIELVSSL